MANTEEVVRKNLRLEFTGPDGKKVEAQVPLVFRIECPTLTQHPPKAAQPGARVRTSIESPTLGQKHRLGVDSLDVAMSIEKPILKEIRRY